MLLVFLFVMVAMIFQTIDDLSWPKVKFLVEEAEKILSRLANEKDEEVVLRELGALLSNKEDHPYEGDVPNDEREKHLRQRVFLDNKFIPGIVYPNVMSVIWSVTDSTNRRALRNEVSHVSLVSQRRQLLLFYQRRGRRNL